MRRSNSEKSKATESRFELVSGAGCAALEEQHVSRAAERLAMSQPAVSRALARLRTMLGDPLLVRTSAGFVLSSRAQTGASRT